MANITINSVTNNGGSRPSTIAFNSVIPFQDVWVKSILTLSTNITLSLGTSPVAQSFHTLIVTGNGINTITFPSNWVNGNSSSFEISKVSEIILYYNGSHVIYTITSLGNIPDITAPTISNVSITNIASTSATFNIRINEAGGIKWAIYPTATTARSKSEILAGTGALSFGSITTAGNINETASLTGLTASTAYKVHYYAVDNANNETAVSLTSEFTTAVSLNILLSDTFDDGTIDLAKWDITDPADGVTISETGGRLRFAANPASAVASTNTNYVSSDLSFNSSVKVLRASLFNNAQAVNQTGMFKFYNAADTYSTARQVQISKTSASTPKAILRIYNGTSFIYDFTTTTDWNNNSFKIVIELNNDIKFFVWGGTSWTQLGATQNYDLGGAVKVSFNANSSSSDTGSPNVEFDNLYVTDQNYNILIPS